MNKIVDSEMVETEAEKLSDQLKRVLRFMPAPVSVVTSHDDNDEPVGLAMSAIMPVSLDPCSMAISINRDNSSYPHFRESGVFCINLLHAGMKPQFLPFADYKARDERFRGSSWKVHEKLWYLEQAPASIFCSIESVMSHGTHDVIIGKVFHLIASDEEAVLGWANGSLGTLSPIQEA